MRLIGAGTTINPYRLDANHYDNLIIHDDGSITVDVIMRVGVTSAPNVAIATRRAAEAAGRRLEGELDEALSGLILTPHLPDSAPV